MAAMLGNSVAVVAVVRTRPRAIPLAMITTRKSTHGFLFLSYMSMGLRLAALRAAGAPMKNYELWTMNWCTCGAESTTLSKTVPNSCEIIITMFKPFICKSNTARTSFGIVLYLLPANLTVSHSYLHIFLGRWFIQRGAFQWVQYFA